jgi:hypothetical protein
VDLLGVDDGAVDWSVESGSMSVILPERLPASPVHVLRLTPASELRVPERSS